MLKSAIFLQLPEFISGLSIFSQKGNKEKKLRCKYPIFLCAFKDRMFIFVVAFSVYDIDNDGFISNGELFLVLKMMVGNNLTDTQLQQIVDKSILEADTDKDGKISFEEFVKVPKSILMYSRAQVIGNSTDDVDTKLTFSFEDQHNNND